jgi:hypothetical protein
MREQEGAAGSQCFPVANAHVRHGPEGEPMGPIVREADRAAKRHDHGAVRRDSASVIDLVGGAGGQMGLGGGRPSASYRREDESQQGSGTPGQRRGRRCSVKIGVLRTDPVWYLGLVLVPTSRGGERPPAGCGPTV